MWVWGVTSHTHRRQSKAVGQRGSAGETIAAWGGRSDAAREQDAHAARGMQDGRQNLNSHILGTRVHSRRLASRLSRACFTSLFTTSELSEAAPMRISTATFFWRFGRAERSLWPDRAQRTRHTPHRQKTDQLHHAARIRARDHRPLSPRTRIMRIGKTMRGWGGVYPAGSARTNIRQAQAECTVCTFTSK